MVEFSVGDDTEPAKEYEHVYEVGEGGPTHRLIDSSEEKPSLSEAADIFEVDEDELSWILTREKGQTDGEDKREPKSIPCVKCGRDVPMSHKRAAEIKHRDDVSVKCGRCAMRGEIGR